MHAYALAARAERDAEIERLRLDGDEIKNELERAYKDAGEQMPLTVVLRERIRELEEDIYNLKLELRGPKQ